VEGRDVLLLDRPQQPPRLVQVRVVIPALLRLEALARAVAAAAAVELPVRAGAVPRQAHEEGAVGRLPVERVRRPEWLAGFYDCNQVLTQQA